MCFCNLYLVSDVFKLLLSFCSVMFFCLLSFSCRSSAVFLVISLCHCLLSCCSVLFSESSFDVFIWHSVVVIYSRVSLLTFFDMGEEGRAWGRKEGRRRRMRMRRRRRSGLHTNSNNPTLKGGEKSNTFTFWGFRPVGGNDSPPQRLNKSKIFIFWKFRPAGGQNDPP